MSRKRQEQIRGGRTDVRRQITTLTRDYRAGHIIPLHVHERDQLVYASRGVMTVRTRNGTWVVPPNRAVWIPANVEHTIAMSGLVAMRTLYVKARLAGSLPRECRVIHVSPLLRELVLHACACGSLARKKKAEGNLIAVILDQLKTVQMVPLQLLHVADARSLRVARVLMGNPGDCRTLAEICKRSGASKRTVERLFVQETGLTFGKWRQQLRLMQAMRLLANGAKITHAALEAGYSTPSAFIAMFRKALGTTPGAYFRG
ncbi:MAG TPA: helix-turn-helix transcriptional regulator [Candidatus Binatia bacterium]|nr:helix-turn-helix transcriptional regulator [Candidatus Binatia bacterium]